MVKFTSSNAKIRDWSEKGSARRSQKQEAVRVRRENVGLTLLLVAIAVIGLWFALSGYLWIDWGTVVRIEDLLR